MGNTLFGRTFPDPSDQPLYEQCTFTPTNLLATLTLTRSLRSTLSRICRMRCLQVSDVYYLFLPKLAEAAAVKSMVTLRFETTLSRHLMFGAPPPRRLAHLLCTACKRARLQDPSLRALTEVHTGKGRGKGREGTRTG